MSAGSPWGPRLVALLILLAVLLAPSGPSARPSEAAPATPQPQATVQRGPGHASTSPTLLGDINNDGIVDTRDYGVWRQNFGQTNCGNPADLNGDCNVDIRDYGIWRANFGLTLGAAARPSPVVPSVPAAPAATSVSSPTPTRSQTSTPSPTRFPVRR